jgi:hypothetical protein
MKPILNNKTKQCVNQQLDLLRHTLNRALNTSSEEEAIIPTTEPAGDIPTLFDVESDLPSLGNRKFYSVN